MSAPNDEGRNELADMPHLSDVQATDALLDRLAARTPTAEDLKDPVVADLALLAEYADASPVPAPGIERLIEVLDGRPLYMFERSTAAVTEADEPIQLDDTPVAARTIDLREPSTPSASEQASGIAARATGTDDVVPVTKLALLRSRRAGGAELKHGWQGVVQQVALPAASVVALLFLGGGVSAVVTGDPMAPVNGVTRVLTGKSPSDKVESALASAQAYVRNNDPLKATQALEKAKSKVGDVPAERQDELQDKIATVAAQVSAAAAANPASSAAPTPSATVPVAESPTPSVPVETTAPSSSPSDSTPSETSTATESTASDAAAAGSGDSSTAGD